MRTSDYFSNSQECKKKKLNFSIIRKSKVEGINKLDKDYERHLEYSHNVSKSCNNPDFKPQFLKRQDFLVKKYQMSPQIGTIQRKST